jgi:penicillin-binding protein 1A
MPKKGSSAPKPSKLSSREPQKVFSFLKYLVMGGLWAILGALVILAWFAYDLPSLKELEPGQRRPSIVYLTADHQEITHDGDLYGETVTTDTVPPYLIQAILSTEDRHFYEHHGINWLGLLRAAFVNIRSGKIVQGGSTLTQQLAKNIFLKPDRSFRRKFQELLISFWLEYHFTKEQLLNIYLNRVYLGSGTYGVDAACQEYFGKPVRSITLAESTVLAALLKAPSRYSPLVHPDVSKQRAKVVAHNMKMAGVLKETSYLKLIKDIEELRFTSGMKKTYNRYFTDWIRDELLQWVDTNQDLLVTTTLNPRMQTLSAEAIQTVLDKEGKSKHATEASFVAMAQEGAVLALVGGKNYLQSQFNRATQARRQAGSAFKMLVFLAALQKGYELDTLISDAPFIDKNWSPKNFGWQTRGMIPLKDAFAFSVNTVAIRLAEKTGISSVISMAQQLGLKGPFAKDLSLALGTASTSLLELTAAYAVVAHNGKKVKPYGILEIRNTQGDILYKHQPEMPSTVLSEDVTLKMQSLLEAVITDGTGKKAQIPGVKVVGKTGTSQNHRDAWFIGYTPSVVAGVWVGNDDESHMKKVTGATLPVLIWKEVVSSLRN